MSAATVRAAAQEARATTQPDFATTKATKQAATARGGFAIRATTVSLVAVFLATLAGSVLADGTSETQGFINPQDIKWGAAPPSMPKGAKIAVLQGDPSKTGPFVMRLRVPAGYKIPPHWHTQDESLTVISGTFDLGTGDKVETEAHTLTPGSFHFLSGKDHHYLVAKTEAVIQINGSGPFDVTYIDAGDDLPKAKK